MTANLQAQLDELAVRVSAIERELRLRRPAPAPVAAAPTPPWPAAPPPRPWKPARKPWRPFANVELSDLLGARALAVAGGIVTLLGIVFCFILAVDHGWVGPEGRVGLGAAASVTLLLAGIELRRRFGTTHAALAAAGAGIGGAYATLLAATSLYHLVPTAGALAAALLIAAAGTGLALWWKAELVAVLGLIGALLAPVAIGLSQVGTAFAAFVLAGALVVALTQRWRGLLLAAVGASLPQIVALVVQPEYHGPAPAGVLALASGFAALYLAAGLALRDSDLGAPLIFGSAALAAASAYRLFGDERSQGLALLAITLVYGALTALAFVRTRRKLSAVLAVPAFTIGALCLAALLSGEPLVYAWAAEAAALSWLARRTREVRFLYWSIAYAVLAAGHLLVFDAPLRLLVEETANRAPAVPAAAAVCLAVSVIAWQSEARLRRVAGWFAGAFGLYALSLTTLALSPSFDWGHVALAGVWSVLGLAALALRRRVAGAVVLSVMAVFELVHDLGDFPRGAALAVAAAALLSGVVLYDRRGGTWKRDPLAGVWAFVSAGAAAAAASLLVGSHLGWAELGIAAVFAAVAGLVRRQRSLATELWALGALLFASGSANLLDGNAQVAAWSVAAAVLAGLAYRTREQRLLAVAGGLVLLGLVDTLTAVGPPTHLFATYEPRTGWLAALTLAAAAAAIAAVWRGRHVAKLWAGAGVLAVYGASIAILALVGWAHGTSDASFHTGHTLVSAFWGVLALALLYAGLTRWRSLRVAGLAVFAVALGKLFLFDLSSLSSITRALSFLAVGAVLLAGGFVYQRLAVSAHRPCTSSGSR